MPQVNPLQYHLSASSIAAFKACPQRFRLAYREGLRVDKDTDTQRRGLEWHKCHEVYAQGLVDFANDDAGSSVCAMNRVVELLNESYATIPTHKTPEEWEVERITMLMSFIGYQWYYQNDEYRVMASEVEFELPIIAPRVNMPLPMNEVAAVGRIDHIIEWHNTVCVLERKSTSRSIAPDSDYWDKAKKDTQISMYALAFKTMPAFRDKRSGTTLYDVWHVPTIKPSMLTQAETRAFCETGEYEGQKFVVSCKENDASGAIESFQVNGATVQFENGKKLGAFAIRETPEMFGARLLQDIYKRPEFYFQRREIARTDAELKQFESQLWAVYQSQKMMEKSGTWFENESACRATYPCPYIPVCFGCGADKVCGPQAPTPDGFKRIFTQLTLDGQPIAEE